jgi:hypothetical protein
MNARSRVHEYGGGQTVIINNDGDTITSDFSTNALVYTKAYSTESGQISKKHFTLSDQDKPYRYADMMLDPTTR